MSRAALLATYCPQTAAGAAVIRFGMACCACAIAVVLAVGLAAAH